MNLPLRALPRAPLVAALWLVAAGPLALPTDAAPRGNFTLEEEAVIREKWPEALETPSGIRYVVLREGDGPRPRTRQRCHALYEGSLLDGTPFDKKTDPADPFIFVLGTRQVIEGWEETFLDMRAGERRLIVLPHALAYGLRGRPPDIPNRAVLVFTVELLKVE